MANLFVVFLSCLPAPAGSVYIFAPDAIAFFSASPVKFLSAPASPSKYNFTPALIA